MPPAKLLFAAAFVERYNHRHYQESLGNPTPAGVGDAPIQRLWVKSARLEFANTTIAVGDRAEIAVPGRYHREVPGR